MLNHSLRVVLLFISVMILSVGVAVAAGPPDATTSTVDGCLVTCPAGDIAFQVIVRDATGTPCPGILVAIDFCPCPEATLCLYGGGQVCGNGKNDFLAATTDANGMVVFYPAAGGTCGGSTVEIIASGVVLARRYVRALDRDGDFVVESSDFTFDNFWNDYTCNGVGDLADLSIFSLHAGPQPHTCDAPVGEQIRTWGGTKSLWR